MHLIGAVTIPRISFCYIFFLSELSKSDDGIDDFSKYYENVDADNENTEDDDIEHEYGNYEDDVDGELTNQ